MSAPSFNNCRTTVLTQTPETDNAWDAIEASFLLTEQFCRGDTLTGSGFHAYRCLGIQLGARVMKALQSKANNVCSYPRG